MRIAATDKRQAAPTRADAAPVQRLPVIDVARGGAIAMMIAYHFCYDLAFFGLAQFNIFLGWQWIVWRHAIVTSFLLLVGASLVLAQLQSWRGYWRRLLQVGGCAVLVSLASGWMFAERFIYFGILHFVVAASLLGRLALPLGRWAIGVGLLVIALGTQLQWPEMDAKTVNWIGLAAHKPATVDYEPLMPWLGVVLIGMGATRQWQRQNFRVPQPLADVVRHAPRWLGWLGRHSLLVYMLHQPLLMGGLSLVRALVK